MAAQAKTERNESPAALQTKKATNITTKKQTSGCSRLPLGRAPCVESPSVHLIG